MDAPSYRNRHGDLVEVKVSRHAVDRFLERWRRIFPGTPIDEQVSDVLSAWFNAAVRIKPESQKYRNRIRRHGRDTLYFRLAPFVFVVQDTVLITVELGTRTTRHLNHHHVLLSASVNSALRKRGDGEDGGAPETGPVLFPPPIAR